MHNIPPRHKHLRCLVFTGDSVDVYLESVING